MYLFLYVVTKENFKISWNIQDFSLCSSWLNAYKKSNFQKLRILNFSIPTSVHFVGKLKLLYLVEKIGLPTRYLLATAVWGKVLPIVESWNNCRILAKLIHAPLKKHLASFLSKLKNWNKQIQLLLIPNTCDLSLNIFLPNLSLISISKELFGNIFIDQNMLPGTYCADL